MPVAARNFLRKVRGGAQAHLIEADDGNCYIVKFQNNPQHRRILVNEFLAGEVLGQLQITAPPCTPIRVSREFIEANPGMGHLLGTTRTPPEPGWHFASRHPGHPTVTAIFDTLPDALYPLIANPQQFLGAVVFDRWVSNADVRQTIFLRATPDDWLTRTGIPPRKTGFVVLLIDNGFAFNGPYWDFPESAIHGLYPRRHVYTPVRSLADFEPWLTRVENFPPEVLDRALRRMPQEWIGEDEDALARMLEQLMRRQKRIREIVYAARATEGNPFPNWLDSR